MWRARTKEQRGRMKRMPFAIVFVVTLCLFALFTHSLELRQLSAPKNEARAARLPSQSIIHKAERESQPLEGWPTFFFVMSGRDNFKARRAVRQTWGKLARGNLVFVVGNKWCAFPPRLQSNAHSCKPTTLSPEDRTDVHRYNEGQVQVSINITQESATYKDMLVLDIVDSYGNLAEKTKQAILWAATHKPKHWFFKVDDDVVINAPLVHEYVLGLDPRQLRLVAHFEWNSTVLKDGKWAELNYKGTFYPPYPQGLTGYILSPALVQHLANNEHHLKLYKNEDVSVGIWLQHLNLTYRTMVFDESKRFFEKVHDYTRRHCLRERRFNSKFVFGHNLSPEDIRSCFSHLQRVEAFYKRHESIAERANEGRSHKTPSSKMHLVKPRRYKATGAKRHGFPIASPAKRFVILVLSSRGEFKIRTAIRQLWERMDPCKGPTLHCELKFVLGKGTSFSRELYQESIANQDVLVANVTEQPDNESWRNHALFSVLDWIGSDDGSWFVVPRKLAWVLFCDTSCVVNANALEQLASSDSFESLQKDDFVVFTAWQPSQHSALMMSPPLVRLLARQRIGFLLSQTPGALLVDYLEVLFAKQQLGTIKWKYNPLVSSQQDPCVRECCAQSQRRRLSFGPFSSLQDLTNCAVHL